MDKFTKLDLNSITSNNRMNIFNCILEAKEINRAVIAKKSRAEHSCGYVHYR